MFKNTKLLLILSVLLNLFLIGAGLGTFGKRAYDNPWKQASQELQPQTQNLVARQFQTARRDMVGPRKKFHDARRDISKILQKEELDEEAYEKAAERMFEAQQKMLKLKMDMMKDIMSELPPEEREKLSDRLMKPFGKSQEAIYKVPHDYPKPQETEDE
ncbi:MAG: periplasmic heavy metal sensor [Alphaproteobacteria bacterium]|nr:periplasmic heavy metal sensor [Alphaproteobacteria bacterium]